MCFAASIVFILAGCLSVEQPEPHCFAVNNGKLALSFVDPALSSNNNLLGCRFMKSAWIIDMRMANSNKPIFRRESIWPKHPTFGCPQEFIPAIELDKGSGKFVKYFKVGVGVILKSPKNWINVKLVRAFKWNTVFLPKKDALEIYSIQNSGKADLHNGYAYILEQRIIVPDGKAYIVLKQTLKNTGTKILELGNYIHPFFKIESDSRFQIGSQSQRTVKNSQNSIKFTEKDTKDTNSVTAFLSPNMKCVIAGETPISRSKFWQSPGKKCFAVEPFVSITLAPGEKRDWGWKISIDK